jgi:hypothetical protein
VTGLLRCSMLLVVELTQLLLSMVQYGFGWSKFHSFAQPPWNWLIQIRLHVTVSGLVYCFEVFRGVRREPVQGTRCSTAAAAVARLRSLAYTAAVPMAMKGSQRAVMNIKLEAVLKCL